MSKIEAAITEEIKQHFSPSSCGIFLSDQYIDMLYPDTDEGWVTMCSDWDKLGEFTTIGGVRIKHSVTASGVSAEGSSGYGPKRWKGQHVILIYLGEVSEEN